MRSWLSPYLTIWNEYTGGKIIVKNCARGLKEFDEHPDSIEWFRNFCRDAAKDYTLTIHRFLRNPGPWRPKREREWIPE